MSEDPGLFAPPGSAAEIEEGRTESFGQLPTVVSSPSNPLSDAKVSLGRMLWYDERLSKDHTVSCNTCHLLDGYGVDGKRVSTGHAQQQGTRNSPSAYNAAGYFALMGFGFLGVVVVVSYCAAMSMCDEGMKELQESRAETA